MVVQEWIPFALIIARIASKQAKNVQTVLVLGSFYHAFRWRRTFL
jgi:hypothetical protein